MAESHLKEIPQFGQSIWFDNIRKGLIASGELQRMIDEDGLLGVTSNPAIFEKAIDGSNDYNEILATLVHQDKSLDQIYETLVTEDIKAAAAIMRQVYAATGGRDGFVSLEVPADLAHHTNKTIAEARRLHELLNLPNLMVKIPATKEGIPAIRQMIAEGRNINVTLIFSEKQYAAVMEAYISGLEERDKKGLSVANINSVASFFVSRIDSAIDAMLEKKIAESTDEAEKKKLSSLLGKIAIANAKSAYAFFQETFGAERFQKLKAKGARVQRPLWASTSTKNPNYRDVVYVEALIGADTVDTVPPATFAAFRDHGIAASTLGEGLAEAKQQLKALEEVGIDLAAVTENLEREGVKQFEEAMDKLIHSLAVKREEVLGDLMDRQTAVLPPRLQEKVDDRIKAMQADSFGRRYWEKDPTLWKAHDERHASVIKNRLGWLDVAEKVLEHYGAIHSFASDAKRSGFTHAVLLGMGGSSLCPEALTRTFAKNRGFLKLIVLDSTNPDAVAAVERHIPIDRTLFIVSSKSGGTIEANSFYRYFRSKLEATNRPVPGSHFVAITDPGTSLERLAKDEGFRHTWLNPPDIGGRYSALSYFGMVPAALMGVDVCAMLESAIRMQYSCSPTLSVSDNYGLTLGAIFAEAAEAGRDKITLVTSGAISYFGTWAEQLIAESTGKEGKGLIPVDGEPLGAPSVYGDDRIFVNIQLAGDSSNEKGIKALEAAGHPVIRILMEDPIDLGEEFYRWEMAIGAAGALMGIDAFDEPNVQESKDNTKAMLQTYETTGSLPQASAIAEQDGVLLYAPANQAGSHPGGSVSGYLKSFLAQAKAGDYVAMMAYIRPDDYQWDILQKSRTVVRDAKTVATTLGYGPRFLHSTGQLHKGGPAKGLFIQITSTPHHDVEIPGQKYSFGTLIGAQAAGDEQCLSDHGLRFVRLHLKNGDADLPKLADLIEEAAAG
ncbi:MAG TPA: bifunctional transaldolase/phosoglucose isomerase [Armatimonadota bacterium]|nr:bifunctional transaldolase/phosoglucose isomerase [Armatimonadota bacterium]